MKNWTEIHKFHCDALMKDPRPYVVNGILKSAMPFYLSLLEYASSSQDFNNLREIIKFYTADFLINQRDSATELLQMDVVIIVAQILLGDDENAYNFVKQLAFGEARDSKSLEKDILKEDFLALRDTKLISNENSRLSTTISILVKELFWCVLIAIKINVIEDMKFLLTQYEAYHRKMKKRFWPHPRITNLYTLYILGTDKKSFLQDLEFEEDQVKLMVNNCQAMILGLILYNGHQSEEKYRRISFIELAIRRGERVVRSTQEFDLHIFQHKFFEHASI